MKKLILTLVVMLCCLSATDAQTRSGRSTGKAPAANFKFSNSKWSKSINVNQDISTLSYQDLYYLRALVYASHGRWYTEAELNLMLKAKAGAWYDNLMSSRVQKFYAANQDYDEETGEKFNKFLLGDALTAAEQAFVNKIDARMAELKGEAMNGRTMENPQLCVNICQFKSPSADLLDKLDKYNFAIEKTECEQLFNIYEENDYGMVPNFITTDTYLQISHMYLAYVQKYIEHKFFIEALGNTLTALYKQSMSDAAKLTGEAHERSLFVATYAAVGVKLLTDKDLSIPEEYKHQYNAEIESINLCSDQPSDLMETQLNFSYSLFRPRGHYTRNEDMKRFFRAMMWVQTATFPGTKDYSVKRATALAMTYNALPADVRKSFEGMGDIITQLTGESDNVSILQLAGYLKEKRITAPDAIDKPEVLADVKAELSRLNSQQNQLSSKQESFEGFNVNMMPQRFLVDNEILHEIVDDRANCELPFPRGLDVFAAFGSEVAEALLIDVYNDDKKWSEFHKALNKMKTKYSGKPVGKGTIYDRRLQLLVNMSNKHPKETAYSFYNTTDWKKKELNTSLASWATLKHDAILYAEQPMVAECGAGEELPPPRPTGFVEPNTEFWNELSSLIADTKKWIEKNGFIDDELSEKTDNLLNSINTCRDIAAKEVKGEAVNGEDKEFMKGIGSSLEWMTLGLIDPQLTLNSWSDVKGADRSIAQVADVFTRSVFGCKKNGVLYAACGNANAIYVLVNINGKTYLTRGATYGYYEFQLPLNVPRLTDEEWQEELKKNHFDLPIWLQPYIINGNMEMNEQEFYGSGC